MIGGPLSGRPLRQVALAGGDFERTLPFWTDTLGIRLIETFPKLAFFDVDGLRVVLEAGGAPGTIYFAVDDIDTAYRALDERGVTFAGPPHRIHRDDTGTFGAAGEEEWMAFFKDPAGNTLALAARRAGA